MAPLDAGPPRASPVRREDRRALVDAALDAALGAAPLTRASPFEVTAPPGRLGLLLANKVDGRGPTHVSAVRSESVLAGKVKVGDVLIGVDGEDVTGMHSREVTAVVGGRVESERVLRLLPAPEASPRQEWI